MRTVAGLVAVSAFLCLPLAATAAPSVVASGAGTASWGGLDRGTCTSPALFAVQVDLDAGSGGAQFTSPLCRVANAGFAPGRCHENADASILCSNFGPDGDFGDAFLLGADGVFRYWYFDGYQWASVEGNTLPNLPR